MDLYNDKEEDKMTMTRPQYGINPLCLTNKKNVWFGPLHKVAEAVMQLKYPDFRADPKKVDTLWRKHKCPGYIGDNRVNQMYQSLAGRNTFYLRGDKFKAFVLRNIFNMKLVTKKS